VLLRSEKVCVWNNLIKVITAMPIPSELFCTLNFIQCILYYYVLISLPHICQHIFCLKIEKILIISHFNATKYYSSKKRSKEKEKDSRKTSLFSPPPLPNTSWAQERGWEWEWKANVSRKKKKEFSLYS